jgi:hypothetical protein
MRPQLFPTLILSALFATGAPSQEDLPEPPVLPAADPAPAAPPTSPPLATPDIYLQLAALTDGEDEGPRFIRQVIERLSRQLVNVEAATWEEIAASLDPTPTSQLVADIYAKHLSEAEAEDLLAFYLSPLGTRLRQLQPILVRESVAAKQLWGREVMAQILQLVEQKTGLKLEEAPTATTPAPAGDE